MVNLIWFADKKMLIMSTLSNMAAWNQMSHELETQPSPNLCVLVHCLAGSCKCQAIPTITWKRLFWAIFMAAILKLQQFVISEQDEIQHRSRVGTQQITAPVETSKLVITSW